MLEFDFNIFLNSLSNPILIADKKLNIIHYNDSLLKFVNLNKKIEHISDIFDSSNLEILYRNVSLDNKKFLLNIEHENFSNSFLVNFYIDKDRYIFILEDIQKRIELEKKLEIFETHIKTWLENQISIRVENQKKYEFLFNSINDALVIGEFCTSNLFKNFQEVNQKAVELLKFTKDEFFKINPKIIYSQLVKTNLISIINSIITHKEYIFETELLAKDGELIQMEKFMLQI